MMLKWRRTDIYMMSSRRIKVSQRPFDIMCLLGVTKTGMSKKLSNLENEISKVYF